MTFKDLEKWEQEGIIDSLKPGENPYVEYTKDDIIAGLKKENQELKNQQKEFIEWLEQNIENEKYCYLSADKNNQVRYDIFSEILSKYKEIIGGDSK